VQLLGGGTVGEVPVPAGCPDGFLEAFYGRPEAFLDPEVRRSQSSWRFVPRAVAERGLARLRDDLASGRWDERYGALREAPEFDGSLRLVTGRR